MPDDYADLTSWAQVVTNALAKLLARVETLEEHEPANHYNLLARVEVLEGRTANTASDLELHVLAENIVTDALEKRITNIAGVLEETLARVESLELGRRKLEERITNIAGNLESHVNRRVSQVTSEHQASHVVSPTLTDMASVVSLATTDDLHSYLGMVHDELLRRPGP